jgi:nicotinate-nucleotide adenylyltransferase
MILPSGSAGVLGLFGGTFDPVHNGHLRTAFELRQRLAIDCVYFIPAGEPPHRDRPVASSELRVAMLEAALGDVAGSVIDLRELSRDGPSYTIDTAKSFRDEFPNHVLCLMLGMDAFLGLPGWRDWEALLERVNLIVARRPGASLPRSGALGELLAERSVLPDASTCWQTAGQIIVQDVTQLEIASTDLRASIRAGVEPRYLVPAAVGHIIATSGCYAR